MKSKIAILGAGNVHVTDAARAWPAQLSTSAIVSSMSVGTARSW